MGRPLLLTWCNLAADGWEPQQTRMATSPWTPTAMFTAPSPRATSTNSAVYGGVFEVAAGSGALTDLGDFARRRQSGNHPVAGVTRDAAGDLFGTTQTYGSTNNAGTIWEIPAGGTLTTIASFLGTGSPVGPFQSTESPWTARATFTERASRAASTNLGETAPSGNCPTAPAPSSPWPRSTIRMGFSQPATWRWTQPATCTGPRPAAAQTMPALSGRLRPAPTRSPTSPQFAGSIGADTVNGYEPSGNVVIDGAGNLFGTTTGGGTSDFGTVWEIPAGGTLTTIASFSGTNGANPYGDVSLDAQGNLFGTTRCGRPRERRRGLGDGRRGRRGRRRHGGTDGSDPDAQPRPR